MTTHLVWLRNDLRMTDNRALYAACQDEHARVIALFIATPRQWRRHDMAPRQAAFLRQNLAALQQALARQGIPLFYQECDDFRAAVSWLAAFCQRHSVSRLFYNYQYEVNERERDRRVERRLAGKVVCQGFDDALLLPPGSVVTGSGQMYKVFTPFRQAFIRRLLDTDIASLPAPDKRCGGEPVACSPLAPFSYPQHAFDEATFPAGEWEALRRLRHFCRERAGNYHQQRDMPALEGTSRLSPYLALGVLSPRQCVNRLREACPDVFERPQGGAFCWLNELIWREFYRHLLVARPGLCKHQPFVAWTRRVRWREDEERLRAWQQGETGYPIVDAAMRQMNQTGWMHNRLRMICASFLVKDLLIDWRAGERYFMSQLLDGDLAANNGGWQWAASTGCDAAPYFRIFNPTTQGKRFDPQGEFIRRWLPELASVPDSAIHLPHPWAARDGRVLAYPAPIVDHRQARRRTLATFEAAKQENMPRHDEEGENGYAQ